jgi:hypothetical protein
MRAPSVRAALLAAGLERCAQSIETPVDNRVRGVVEHLPDNLASDPRVGAALDLDQRWHAVLIDEEMVD